jgi:hypothetical protein
MLITIIRERRQDPVSQVRKVSPDRHGNSRFRAKLYAKPGGPAIFSTSAQGSVEHLRQEIIDVFGPLTWMRPEEFTLALPEGTIEFALHSDVFDWHWSKPVDSNPAETASAPGPEMNDLTQDVK